MAGAFCRASGCRQGCRRERGGKAPCQERSTGRGAGFLERFLAVWVTAQKLRQLVHLAGLKRSTGLPIRLHRRETVRSAALHSMALGGRTPSRSGSDATAERKEHKARPGNLDPLAHGSTLVARRLSMTTMSPGRRSGTTTTTTHASNRSPLIYPSSTMGAAMPLIRRPVTKVVVLRWHAGVASAAARPWRSGHAAGHVGRRPGLVMKTSAPARDPFAHRTRPC
jgi:hypothetical protein